MAKLTDLPAEVVYRIIDYSVYHRTPKHHRDLDHNGIGPVPPIPRPHLLQRARPRRNVIRHPLRPHIDIIPTPPPRVSWPDALPSNPLLALSLVSRTFQQCAQQTLFKNVALQTKWQACLFLRALTCRAPGQDEPHLRRASSNAPREYVFIDDDIEIILPAQTHQPFLNKVAQCVDSLQFRWHGPVSMGKGGGSMICEIIRSCPQLQKIAILPTLLKHCGGPVLEALASRPLIKDFVILKDPREGQGPAGFQWQVDATLAQLISKWAFLDALEVNGLSERPPLQISIPVFRCTLRTLILTRPDLSEGEFCLILDSSRETMQTLKIADPSTKLHPRGLCRILIEHTAPNLESLTVHVKPEWHRVALGASGGLLDIVFQSPSALRELKSLTFHGDLASGGFLDNLPQSIVKLAWNECLRVRPRFAETLARRRTHPWLPNLRCCSILDFFEWPRGESKPTKSWLKARGVCFHTRGGAPYLYSLWNYVADLEEADGEPSDYGARSEFSASDLSSFDSADDSEPSDHTSDHDL